MCFQPQPAPASHHRRRRRSSQQQQRQRRQRQSQQISQRRAQPLRMQAAHAHRSRQQQRLLPLLVWRRPPVGCLPQLSRPLLLMWQAGQSAGKAQSSLTAMGAAPAAYRWQAAGGALATQRVAAACWPLGAGKACYWLAAALICSFAMFPSRQTGERRVIIGHCCPAFPLPAAVRRAVLQPNPTGGTARSGVLPAVIAGR